MNIQPGDVIIANNEPALVITTNSAYGIIVRRYRFTQGGQSGRTHLKYGQNWVIMSSRFQITR